MKKVYAVWRVYPFAGPSHILHLFSSLEKANSKAEAYRAVEENPPEYDSYGLCAGVDHVVEEIEVEE